MTKTSTMRKYSKLNKRDSWREKKKKEEIDRCGQTHTHAGLAWTLNWTGREKILIKLIILNKKKERERESN